MLYVPQEINMPAPELGIEHTKNCKLLPSRYHMLNYLPKGGVCAEVGVAEGEFSQCILNKVQPKLLYLIDIFDGFIAYMPFDYTKETHQEFVDNRFAGKPVRTVKGISWEKLKLLPDKSCDFIYIDAGHEYDACQKDIQAAKNKVKDEGLLIFNDYKMCDHLAEHFHYYGVCKAVNEFCIKEGWEFVYFALQQDMYCDVAIRKIKE